MSLFGKLRPRTNPDPPQRGPAAAHGRAASTAAAATSSAMQASSGRIPGLVRHSNGLKEFLFQLEGIGHGHLLDLGSARQTTITFFIERGFKVYTEDLLTTWKSFLDADEKRMRELPTDADLSEMLPVARAERFLEKTLCYSPDTFDAVLLWDLLDYLDGELVSRLMARMTSLVRDGGVVLAIFHTRKPEAFHRYRILNGQNVELIPASFPLAPQRVYQNREISELFHDYRSSRTFVGREQFRESLFVK